MAESRSLLKSVLSYGTASSATVAAVFLLHIIAGRILGVEDYGRFSFALTFALIFAPVLDLGLYYLLIREVARAPGSASHYLSHALSWKLLCAPGFFLIVFAGAALIDPSRETLTAVALLALAQILLSGKDAFRPILLARERFGLDALSLSIERVALLVVAGATLWAGYGLTGLCWAYVAVRSVDLVIVALLVRPTVPIRLGTDRAALRTMLVAALPIGAFYMTLNVYNYIDTAMLQWLRGHEEVGWYSAAYRLYEGPVLVPAIIGTVFMPRLSRLYLEDRTRFAAVLKQGAQWVALAAVGVFIIGFAAAEWLVHISYGPAFDDSVRALRILLTGLLFVFTINFLQTVMIAVDRQRVVFLAAAAGLVLNVALNAALIPRWGLYGASAATVSVEGALFVVLALYALRNLPRETAAATVAGTGNAGPV